MLSRFDAERARLVLRELEKTMGCRYPRIKWELEPGSSARLRGIADRAAVFHLGLRLAACAMEAESGVAIDAQGFLRQDAEPGLLEIILTDEPAVVRKPAPGPKFACILLALILLFLLVMGLGTTIFFVIQLLGPSTPSIR